MKADADNQREAEVAAVPVLIRAGRPGHGAFMPKRARTFLLRWFGGTGLMTALYLASFRLFMDLHLVTDNSAPWPEGDLHGPRTYWSLNENPSNRMLRNLYSPLIAWKFSYPEDWHK